MGRKWMLRIGIVFGALIALAAVLRVVTALRSGDPFMGETYWGAPIGTYLAAALLAVIVPFCIFLVARNWRKL